MAMKEMFSKMKNKVPAKPSVTTEGEESLDMMYDDESGDDISDAQGHPAEDGMAAVDLAQVTDDELMAELEARGLA